MFMQSLVEAIVKASSFLPPMIKNSIASCFYPFFSQNADICKAIAWFLYLVLAISFAFSKLLSIDRLIRIVFAQSSACSSTISKDSIAQLLNTFFRFLSPSRTAAKASGFWCLSKGEWLSQAFWAWYTGLLPFRSFSLFRKTRPLRRSILSFREPWQFRLRAAII